MNEEIILSSEFFSLTFDKGFLSSLRPGPGISGKTDTVFFRPGAVLGPLRLALSDGRSCVMDGGGGPAEVEVRCDAELERREILDSLGLAVAEVWRLAGEYLRLEIRIENKSPREICLEDLGLSFPAYSDFSWGCDTASRVIGHHWIAGHNSHLVFQRCDGLGPVLAVLPQGDTSLEYQEKAGEARGSAEVYMHSVSARRPAEAAGAKIHLPASRAVLASGECRTWSFCFVWARDMEDVRAAKIRCGLMDVQVLPGMTAPAGEAVSLALRGSWKDWPERATSSFRVGVVPYFHAADVGFRPVIAPKAN